jgi:hypothetical protein
MGKHGFCTGSNKRNHGKGRKPLEKITLRSQAGETVTYFVGNFRTEYQSTWGDHKFPSRKRVKGNRRRRRRAARSSVTLVQAELREENAAKKRAVEKMKKTHARTVRQMQKRFLRDIHKLWEMQAEQMSALEKGI